MRNFIWLGVECAHKLKGEKSFWFPNLITFGSMLRGANSKK
jgi:hypothetical protein